MVAVLVVRASSDGFRGLSCRGGYLGLILSRNVSQLPYPVSSELFLRMK